RKCIGCNLNYLRNGLHLHNVQKSSTDSHRINHWRNLWRPTKQRKLRASNHCNRTMNCFTKETKYSLHKLISKSSIRSIWRIGRKSEKHDMYASDWRGCIGVASMELC
uniref:Uncharacterized protein n=1 Tax=Anopheles atroparvus TaxID=41427 RepID=A0AAG5DFC2_ANOAO